MRRKQPVTFNIPPNVLKAARTYAEKSGRSFSTLVEYILREYLAAQGVVVDPLGAEELAVLEKFHAATAKSETKPAIKGKKTRSHGK